AASSTTFLPIAWMPASSSATVPEPSGRVAALCCSSAKSSSNDFTPASLVVRRGQELIGPGSGRVDARLQQAVLVQQLHHRRPGLRGVGTEAGTALVQRHGGLEGGQRGGLRVGAAEVRD